ncbi:MAG: hypothetical protein NTU83_13615, partial [Candidatus Hydrogenedentes bacterium]|nr:hypothetical protein [Candidatus Hydrogenedentota bacterium]
YLDTRGELVRTPVVTTRGTVAVKPDGANAWWVIPATKCEEISIARAWLNTGGDMRYSATACMLDGSPVGPATVLMGVDAVTVVPVADASIVKYRLTAEASHEAAITEVLLASRVVLTTNSVSATATVNGLRHELVWCRDYLYLDTRGELVRTPVVTTRGTVAVKPDGANAWWVIPATKCEEISIARA